MEAYHLLHVRIFQGAGLNDLEGAIQSLLPGLENQLYHAGKPIPPLVEQLGYAQQDGHMTIMSAGVGCARILGGIGDTALFGERKGIDISPKAGDGTIAQTAPDDGD